MIRVAIIDDENLVRLGIRSSVNWEEHGYTVIGEAADGDAGLRLILDKSPDLVFLDIAMPGMDGISLLKEARARGANCHVVILSCHDDFDYVRQSMRYGAIRYVLKNEVDAGSIIELLESLKGDILQGKGQPPPAEDGAPDEERTIRRILQGKPTAPEERRHLCEGHAWALCAAFSVKDHLSVIGRYEGAQMAVLHSRVIGFCQEWARTVPGFQVKPYCCDDNGYLLLFLGGEEMDVSDMERRIAGLRGTLNSYMNLDIWAGLGRAVPLPDGLERGIQQAAVALRLHFFDPRPVRAYQEEADVLHSERVYQLMHELYVRSLERDLGRVQPAIRRLVEVCQQIAREQVFDAGLVFNCIRNMLRLADLPKYGADIEALLSSEDADAFLAQLDEATWGAVSAASGGEKRSPLVEEALRHIQLHYRDDISLQSIAQALHVNKSHLCRVFSREMNLPLHEYLNEQRIERAKQLIRLSDMKMYDVALSVGFKNTTHFNVTFKKLVHMTPVEYKNSGAE